MDEKKRFKVWLAEDGLESAREILADDHEAAAQEWARLYDQGDYPLSRNEGEPVRIICDGNGTSLVFDVAACITTRYDIDQVI